jgi:hypothetical protein
VKIIIINVIPDTIKKITCLPTIVVLSKIDVNDSLKLEEKILIIPKVTNRP